LEVLKEDAGIGLTIYFNCKVKLAQSAVDEAPHHENEGRTRGIAIPCLNLGTIEVSSHLLALAALPSGKSLR
jgi:hypothetical protein